MSRMDVFSDAARWMAALVCNMMIIGRKNQEWGKRIVKEERKGKGE